MVTRISRIALVAAVVVPGFVLAGSARAADEKPDSGKPGEAKADEKVSYYTSVRLIFQTHCQGCHQPAKPSGEYVMTAFDRLFKGGDSGKAGVVAGKPDQSYLVEMITPKDGKADMPKDKAPLSPKDIDTIKKWIAQGAVDDTPAGAKEEVDMEHPPVYTRQPVITSLDFSPDGTLLAVAGFHEVLLMKADGSERVGRLVGMSDRIESVRFSPDGKKLAVAGGLPGRMGEIQVWDVAARKLVLSHPETYDTLYGGNWSPDGKLICFGCADNTVRAINAETGEQVLYQGAHDDWVRDNVFSVQGTHVVSVGRDMSVKLTEVATQRFIDNLTSITPGALKGGIQTISRHPKFDNIVVGGSDGTPRVYRLFRETNRMIGDDANLIMNLFPMTGRVFGATFSDDGKRIACVSTLDGKGELLVCSYDYESDVPANIKAIMGKVPGARSPDERKALDDYRNSGMKQLAKVTLDKAAAYAVAFNSAGTTVAVAGGDGLVRFFDPTTGAAQKEFAAAPVTAEAARTGMMMRAVTAAKDEAPSAGEKLPPGKVVSLKVEPAEIKLGYTFAYAQLVVTGKLDSGASVDLTRVAEYRPATEGIRVSGTGLVRPAMEGQTSLVVNYDGQSATVPVTVSGLAMEYPIDYIRDVGPVLSKLGCNQGTCHGSAKGKNGFKLSLRGYDAIFDVRALSDDYAARRVNLASPDDSLMLLKPTGAVPHVGAGLMQPGEVYYEIIRQWIANGVKLDLNVPRVTKIELSPSNPVVELAGGKQQFRILATYSDGQVRDVTREAFIEGGNIEIVAANKSGLVTALRRGEAPILARYEGAYAATTLTVMGDRSGFAWVQPPAFNKIDELVAEKWKQMKILPSGLCTDADFIRRVTLDLTGLPPKSEDVVAFLADTRDTKVKRDELIDKLVGSPDYVDHWTNKWADLLQVNRKFLGADGAAAFRKWIRDEIAANTPYDQFAKKILTASGSNREHPEASYFKILRTPDAMMENTTHLFLAVRFNCNKCHDHPFERWTQDQYYHTAAYFAQVGLSGDPATAGQNIGGTAVEGAKPLYEIVKDTGGGEVTHERTGKVTPPEFPYAANFTAPPAAPRRELLADWITSRDNQYFAKSYANRLWGYLFGVGIMEPIDDIRAGNPPTNPALIDYLTQEFLASNFDVRHMVKLICKSRTYQLAVESNQWNADDKINYSHATARRLPAEVLYDAVYRVTGSVSRIPGVAPGTRAAAIPDSGIDLPSGFFTTFGRPVRESACECERTSGLQLGPVMALISGPTVSDAIGDPSNDLTRLVTAQPDDKKLVNEIFLRVVNRTATEAEIQAVLESAAAIDADHLKLVAARDQRDREVAPARTRAEQARTEAITQATAALKAYEAEIAPAMAMKEKDRNDKIAAAEASLKEYEAGLAPKVAAWEAGLGVTTGWTTLNFTEMKSTNNAKLEKEADGSLYVSGPQGKTVYQLKTELSLKGITGLRLEALTDDRLPARGPGRAPNGNIVVTELEITLSPKSNPAEKKKLTLQNPKASFSQAQFEIAKAIDGNRDAADNGWALSPELGKPHTAVFEIKDPSTDDAPQIVLIEIHQKYTDGMHALGRFRLSTTTDNVPLQFGIPKDVQEVLAVAAATRNEAQKTKLTDFYKQSDAEWLKRKSTLEQSRQPLPPDPKLIDLKSKLETAQKPIPEDPKLAELKRDVEMSQSQLNNKRLTMAQDLTWALINSPAFLFNH